MITRDEMRKPLTKFMDSESAEKIRVQLREHAGLFYKKEHTAAEYIQFMKSNDCDSEQLYGQDTNHPWGWQLFTIVSQHVYGDCIEECFDKAIAISEGRRELHAE